MITSFYLRGTCYGCHRSVFTGGEPVAIGQSVHITSWTFPAKNDTQVIMLDLDRQQAIAKQCWVFRPNKSLPVGVAGAETEFRFALDKLS